VRIGEHQCFIRGAEALSGVAIGSTLTWLAWQSHLYKLAASVPATTLLPVVLINIIAGAMLSRAISKRQLKWSALRNRNVGKDSSYSVFSRTLLPAWLHHPEEPGRQHCR
jgi:hypothetical protein